jgi:HSP20 family molecular chaperone IbpA
LLYHLDIKTFIFGGIKMSNMDLFLNNFFDFDNDFSKVTKSQIYNVVEKKNKTILIQNVLGINKEDLSVKLKTEQGRKVLYTTGSTKDAITEKEYSINTRFIVNASGAISNVSSEVKNGLLYIEIDYKEPKEQEIKIL